jgi:hypothetical protein
MTLCLDRLILRDPSDVGNALQRLDNLTELTKTAGVKSEDSGLCRQCQKSMIAKGLRPCPRYRQVRILSLQLGINHLHR